MIKTRNCWRKSKELKATKFKKAKLANFSMA
jgi:hypothetical protein